MQKSHEGVVAIRSSWKSLAWREFRWLIRNPMLWVYAVLLVLIATRTTANIRRSVRLEVGTLLPFVSLQYPIGALAPIAGILIGYRAIAGEREQRTLRIVGAMPHTRRDILAGKFLGRGGALLVATMLPAGLLLLVSADTGIRLVSWLLFTIVTVLYLLQNVAVGISISVVCSKVRTAAAIGFGYIVMIQHLWMELFVPRIAVSVSPLLPNVTALELQVLLNRLSPMLAYRVVTNEVIGAPNSSGTFFAAILDLQPDHFTDVIVLEQAMDQPFPTYLTPEFSLAILLVWFVSAIVISERLFRNAEF